MNQEKMAKFICQLRKEKKLSQEALGNMLFVSREAVSKWERAVNCPEPNILLQLSELFNVSINELLYGERKNKENKNKINKITYHLYTAEKKHKKTIKFLISIILLFIFAFLLFYFFVNYNSISVYKINYNSEDLQIINGVIVSTNEKLYFNLGNLKSDKTIIDIELYYIDNNSEKKIIMNTNNTNISFYELAGYEEYFDFKNKNNVINNLCIKVTFEGNDVSDIELNPQKFISNNYFLPKKYSKI